MRMEKKYNLLDMILQKHEEHSSDWEKDNPVGSRNMKIQQSDYDTYGRSDLLKEARELEEQKLIKVKWWAVGRTWSMSSIGWSRCRGSMR